MPKDPPPRDLIEQVNEAIDRQLLKQQADRLREALAEQAEKDGQSGG